MSPTRIRLTNSNIDRFCPLAATPAGLSLAWKNEKRFPVDIWATRRKFRWTNPNEKQFPMDGKPKPQSTSKFNWT